MPKQPTTQIDIPYEKFTLANGLTVIVHEDHKAPIVAVNIWYHVGSKNEKQGKTGFAHLFEHLMFNGSENFDDDYFQALERVGATDLNGTTSEDRTNYFQNVPTSALDLAMWMESDRMGHMVGAISQKKLDEQRGVVQNEKRQGENEPYAVTEELVTKATFPAGHPYSWTVIGSMADLNAASLDDVKEWFRQYYGPSNAVLVLAGDIDVKTAREKAEKYFGDIPPGPPIAHFNAWIAKRTGEQRQQVQDRVPQARIYKVWNIPQSGTETETWLDLASDVLASSKVSRLYKRLVYDDQIATAVSAGLDSREIAGQFVITATAKPGGDLKKIEQAIDEELAKFIKSGPTEKELERVKTQYEAGFIRGIERIGGFGGKSDILAKNQVFHNDPEFYKTYLQRVQSATTSQLQHAAKEWLSDGVYVLEVYPFPQYTKSETGADRKALPAVGAPPTAKFPKLERATLSNGLKVVLAERTAIPTVDVDLIVDAGYAADLGIAPGTASMTTDMIGEGTAKRTSLQISEELGMLGASFGKGSNLDVTYVSMSMLKKNLDASLSLYADLVLNPTFPQEDFLRTQKLKIARIQREKATPVQMALRVLPGLMYGKDHAYGNPMTGSGTEESIQKMTRADLVKFHTTWVKPNNATLVVVGATTMKEMLPKLEALFKGWKQGSVPAKSVKTIDLPKTAAVYVIDKPGAEQSLILAGHVATPKANPEEVATITMNNILGGLFTSRINMNLRENKHWTYGASTMMRDARGQRPFICYAPVQTDKTKDAITEIIAEIRGIQNGNPVSADELQKAQKSQTLELPGSWETNGAIANTIVELVQFGLPDDYYDTYPSKVNALKGEAITAAARSVLHPDNLVWVVVGDKSKIEDSLKGLNLGEVRTLTVE
ncbi:MAG TPA: pitrilysin family protein [Bacteroidota bacterium]|nr:pitrilysin family protein [Bacteroidota bacterium]